MKKAIGTRPETAPYLSGLPKGAAEVIGPSGCDNEGHHLRFPDETHITKSTLAPGIELEGPCSIFTDGHGKFLAEDCLSVAGQYHTVYSPLSAERVVELTRRAIPAALLKVLEESKARGDA